ncbi:Nn.00g008370.m01.CDS01 [Neocucurbitaria sp. VM-36]
MADHDPPDPRPMYMLLVLATAICTFTFWVGTVCVRLWFYKGALGPEPEKFIILRKDLKQRFRSSMRDGDCSDLHESYNNHSFTSKNKRVTVFPHIASPGLTSPDRALSTALHPQRFSTLPTINIQDVNDLDDFKDSKIRNFVAEEVRISRLPPFVQDDCGDGSKFPGIPVALEPIEETTNTLDSSPLRKTGDYLRVGLKRADRSQWLMIDNTYIEYHEARKSLLRFKEDQCIQVKHESETACEELLHEVVQFLTSQYPNHFSICTKDRRKHIRNELTQEEFSLVRPYDHHPLQVCARLAIEDFQVLVKGDFTMQWYLQASATLFPAGWNMRAHIGKPLDSILSNRHEPMPLWEDLPTILTLPDLSPYSFAPSLLTRTEIFIQTRPDKRTLSSLLFTQRPADFFSGNIFNLAPADLLVRRETQTFRRLPKCGAVVISTRTGTRGLAELGRGERRELLEEVRGWGEDGARFKGRDLWITAVEGFCLGKPVFRDDVTVFSRAS